MPRRSIRKQFPALQDDIGDLRTHRPLPNRELSQIDPFLFLNHHGPQVYPPRNNGLPFGPHPHRGFETVTFIVEGSLVHRDTAGHESVIDAGGVQWMTAGRGLEHAELSPEEFKREGGPLEILQLWINLPARLKMTDPGYQGLQRDEIFSRRLDDGRVELRVISGTYEGARGPIPSLTDVFLSMVEARAGGRFVAPVDPGRNIFFYVVRGAVSIEGEEVTAMHLVDFDRSGDSIEFEAITDALVIFGHALPYGESVAAHGPFVMNTTEEILQAVRDYQAGLFR